MVNLARPPPKVINQITPMAMSIKAYTEWGKTTSLIFKVNNKKIFETQKFYVWILKLQHGKF
jgi:hypothetical protein